MSSSSASSSSGGAPIDYHYWVTGRRQGALPPAVRVPDVRGDWEAQPTAWFNEYQLRGSTIETSARAQDNWHLPEVGQGAYTFEAVNAGSGLVTYLTAWNHSDLAGYYIVLDDDNGESYVARVSALGSDRLSSRNVRGQSGALMSSRKYARVAGVSVDRSFRLDPSAPQTFWVIYRSGALAVGRGAVVGAPGTVILQMAPLPNVDRSRGNDMYHFGFARVGERWPGAITVRNAVAYKYAHGPIAPLPPADLLAAASTTMEATPVIDDRRVLYRGGNERLESAITTPPTPYDSTLYGPRRFPPTNVDRSASF